MLTLDPTCESAVCMLDRMERCSQSLRVLELARLSKIALYWLCTGLITLHPSGIKPNEQRSVDVEEASGRIAF